MWKFTSLAGEIVKYKEFPLWESYSINSELQFNSFEIDMGQHDLTFFILDGKEREVEEARRFITILKIQNGEPVSPSKKKKKNEKEEKELAFGSFSFCNTFLSTFMNEHNLI